MKKTIATFFLIASLGGLLGQKSFNEYSAIYPLGEDPNVRWMSSYTPQETILFEGNPTARFSVYNNFVKRLVNGDTHMQAWYFLVKPQFRMYTEISRPVKTPSYRVSLGTQHMFRLRPSSLSNARFWGFLVESGHYSNGQNGAAFSENFKDGSAQSDSIYKTITNNTDLSAILNRSSGNYSTNQTELMLNYRTYKLNNDDVPQRMLSFNLGYTLYHNLLLGLVDLGGFTPEDIAIYGRHRINAGGEYVWTFKKRDSTRIAFRQNFEFISKPHASVNPWRSETTVTYYPFKKVRNIGFCLSFITGHDNYNYRFVDAGKQLTMGITWSQFPPIAVANRVSEF